MCVSRPQGVNDSTTKSKCKLVLQYPLQSVTKTVLMSTRKKTTLLYGLIHLIYIYKADVNLHVFGLPMLENFLFEFHLENVYLFQ